MGKRTESTYGAVGIFEAIQTVTSVLPLVLGNKCLEDLGHDVPELGVLFLQQDHEAGGLGVERGWDILRNERLVNVLNEVKTCPSKLYLNSCREDLLDAVVGNRALLGELVDASAVLDRFLEGAGGIEVVAVGKAGLSS